ncbi:hypothetical protein SCP_0600880 [Sparassis crispa]|uniref:Uncharacterized protein n=1 Tax=Sparassis crispa TaxID=139825 RepID=A0A401GPM3_9APHY|nr:hypothetical protein SCP_0600880 [Sparassis crispa]GBE84110.1 hypothetical protein SCP_0600880 [Sparassis crispa]
MEMFIFLDQKNPTWHGMLEEQDDDISINSDSDYQKQEDEPEEVFYEDGSAPGDYQEDGDIDGEGSDST